MKEQRDSIDRRTFLRRGLLAAVAFGSAGSLAALVTRSGRAEVAGGDAAVLSFARVPSSGSAREIRLVASAGEVEVAPGRTYHTWLYNGSFPGPEIRAREGERLRIVVENRLPEGTTIHWHGIPVPNAMDGVPGVTQEPIPAEGTFTYEFVAGPAGSYLYHSHVGLQIDRGLIAPLIVEETTPHVAYDREYTLVLDDFLPSDPQPLASGGMGMMGRMRGGMMRGMGMMMGGIVTPPYQGLLVNGRLPEAAPVFEVKRGERVRLRFMNPAGATTFRVAIAGHRMTVTHTDGRPVEPYAVDSFFIGMGERYDVIVEANNPGVWMIMAAPVEVQAVPARAVLRYADAAGTSLREESIPEGLTRGRALSLDALRSLELAGSSLGRPDRAFNLTLSGGMMGSRWTINGQAYPNAAPLEVHEGEHVRVRMVNHSMMLHPMHLHGHFFRVGNVLKDTVTVPPHMGRAAFDFVADNPGDWFFHCHNIYHLESGMARVIRYV